MVTTYDLSTDVGLVRLLVPDRDPADPLFTDAELQRLLDLEGDPRRAAAAALEVAAADAAATLRVTTVLGLSVNGVAAAQALLDRANRLRALAAEAEARAGALVDWAEWVAPGDPFALRDRLATMAARQG